MLKSRDVLMSRPRILLVNPNLMRPPIAPLGLEYLADVLQRRGYDPVLCDLAFGGEVEVALHQSIIDTGPLAIALSIRNLDDAYFASQDFILERTAGIARMIRRISPAPLILGGVGFSIAPREILALLEADYGIAGENEESMADLLDVLRRRQMVSGVSGLVFRDAQGRVRSNPALPGFLEQRVAPSRRFADHRRYFTEGGQAGVETKRGCAQPCLYCVEPRTKGQTVQLRSPASVADEFADLLDQGIDTVHLCDSEFNQPADHARAVCEALTRRGLGKRIRWYCYASPAGFNVDLARAMAEAGCVGIDFGADHADPAMLARLGRDFGPDDLKRTTLACRDTGIALMFDLLLGGPGETHESMARAIELMRALAPDRVGLSCGVRVYPYTALGRKVLRQGPLEQNPNLHGATRNNDDLLRPIFYVEQAVADIHRIAWNLAGGDPLFLTADPDKVGNYNYNDNTVLIEAIRAGERGAYWDILRRRSQ